MSIGDEYLALGGIELGNNARAYGYSRCLSCCASLLKCPGCDGIHDATAPYAPAVYDTVEIRRNLASGADGSHIFHAPTETDGQPILGFTDARLLSTLTIPGQAVFESVIGGGDGPPVGTVPALDSYAQITYVTDSPGDSTGYALTSLQGSAGPVGSGLPVVAGDTYTLSAWVWHDSQNTHQIKFKGWFARADGTRIVVNETPFGATPPNTWTLIENTFVAPPDAAFFCPLIEGHNTDGPWEAGTHFRATALLVEEAATADPANYFDGSRVPVAPQYEDAVVEWLGPEGLSQGRMLARTLITPAVSLEPPYDCGSIVRAPWYDPSQPESALFAGSYLLSVKGLTDGTLTGVMTESTGPGGVLGLARHASRSIRVRTMLVGCSEAAVEYGLAWLNAALDSNFCGRHGDACGTSDLSFFIDCPPPLDPLATTYDVSRYRRYIHDVGALSDAVVQEEYTLASGASVKIVEFLLGAENPRIYHETVPIQQGAVAQGAWDDIPFNLLHYPSPSVPDNIAQVVATNYASNGSVEYGSGGWGQFVQSPMTGAGADSTAIAAVGTHSYRLPVSIPSDVTGAAAEIQYVAPLTGLAASKVSTSVWGRIEAAGGATINSFQYAIAWLDASFAVLGDTQIGTFDPAHYSGQNVEARGIDVPAGAANARVRLVANIDSPAGGSVIMFADAAAVTVP